MPSAVNRGILDIRVLIDERKHKEKAKRKHESILKLEEKSDSSLKTFKAWSGED